MLVVTDERCLQHDTGVRHPERPERLTAALQGVAAIDAELITGGIPPRMGFCLFNSVAVAAAWLAAAGQRVAVVDIDAHHGNGTQDIFWNRADVLYASIHQHPLYPGTGALSDTGTGPGRGMTVNVPVPTGATGDVARAALDDVIVPAVDRFSPDWMLISAGYDGHQADPLTGLCYSASDYGALVRRLVSLAPRTVAVLEGGYNLEATAASSYAVAGALLDLDLNTHERDG